MTEYARYRWKQKERSRCAYCRSISPIGSSTPMLPQVLATPVMILIMENAALSAIRLFLDMGESAVGTALNVPHLAATPVGRDVRADAEVIKRWKAN